MAAAESRSYLMSDHHANASRQSATDVETTLEAIRQKVATNLAIDPERLRYHDPGQQSRIGVTGERWQIHHRGDLQDLPLHYDGPLTVTPELVRQWLDDGEHV